MKKLLLRLDDKVYEGLVATKPACISMNAHIGMILEGACVDKLAGAMEMARVSGDAYDGMKSEVAGFCKGDGMGVDEHVKIDEVIDYGEEFRQ